MDPFVLFLVLWAILIVPGFFFLLYRVTKNKGVFTRMASTYGMGVALLVASFFLRSGRLGLFIAGMGALMIGVGLLLFREAWAAFNRRLFGSLMAWHRSDRNSRALVLLLGVGACVWGLFAIVSATLSG
jgi:hypothetical protein